MDKKTNKTEKPVPAKKAEPSSVEIGKKIIEEDDEKEQQAKLMALSAAQRLERSIKANTVTVKIKDNLGEFSVECRLFTWEEQQNMATLIKDSSDKNIAEDKEKQEQLTEAFFKLLAYPDGICLDPSLTLEWWRKGKFPQFTPKHIFEVVGSATQKGMSDAKLFRPKQPRATNPQLMRVVEHDNH